MKKLALVILLSLAKVGWAAPDSVSFQLTHGVESTELQRLLEFKDIYYYVARFAGSNLKGKTYTLMATEYWSGTPKAPDTLFNSDKLSLAIPTEELEFTIISEKSAVDSVRFMFRFDRFSFNRVFQTTESNPYSLRDPSNGDEVVVPVGRVTLMVYSLPYEDPERPGYLQYCTLTSKGVPPEKWGEVYDLGHYIVFEMILE